MQQPPPPPARFYWTKELDLRLVRAIQDQLGEVDAVKHQRKEGTSLNWEAVLTELQKSPEGWPSSINSTMELRKRWDNNLRVWYAKSLPATDEAGKLRATTVSLSNLLTLLSKRDYIQDSKPGPKRGTSLLKRKHDCDASFSVDVVRNESKKHVTTDGTDDRLQSWLSLLKNPQFQEGFCIHTHSDIILEPSILFDLSMGCVALRDIPVLARAIASPEWACRLCDIADVNSLQALLTLKKPFFVFPSREMFIEKRLLLFCVVFFENHTPQWFNLVQALEGENDGNLLVATPLDLGISLVGDTLWYNKVTSLSAAGVLDLFSKLLQYPILDTSILGGNPIIKKQQALYEIISKEGVHIQSLAAFPVPFKSLQEAITSIGIKLPPWCWEIGPEKRQSLLDAIGYSANVAVIIIPLSLSDGKKTQEFTWKCGIEEKELCLIAKKADQESFGGILRLRVAEKQRVNIEMLASRSYFKTITTNGVALMEQIEIADGLLLEFTLAQSAKVSLIIKKD